MARCTISQITTLGEDGDRGSAHFTVTRINHYNDEATLLGFQLDQYELDAYTMWVNEIMERHATTD